MTVLFNAVKLELRDIAVISLVVRGLRPAYCDPD